MKKLFILILPAIFGFSSLMAQDTTATKPVNANRSLLGYFILDESKPVRNPYESGVLIDNVTNVMPSAKTLEFIINHRFGDLSQGISNLFGIYGGANTRLTLNYTVTDWAQVGFGTTQNYKLQDFYLKINLIKQSRDKKSPVDVTYYGNWSIDARDESNFGEDYKFGHRCAYFNELLVTRQFTEWLTLSVGGSLTHFNQVDSLYEHDKIALHFLGRVKFSPQSSIIVNCDLPLKVEGIKEWNEFTNPPKYNFGIGYEVATATHAFQVFAGSGQFLVPQYNVMKNQNEFFKSTKDFYLGFNITRLWSF